MNHYRSVLSNNRFLKPYIIRIHVNHRLDLNDLIIGIIQCMTHKTLDSLKMNSEHILKYIYLILNNCGKQRITCVIKHSLFIVINYI